MSHCREVEEETGLAAALFSSVRILPYVSNNILKEGPDSSVTTHTLSVFVECRVGDGKVPEVKLMEPHKCAEWKWVNYDAETAPKPYFRPLQALFDTPYDPTN